MLPRPWCHLVWFPDFPSDLTITATTIYLAKVAFIHILHCCCWIAWWSFWDVWLFVQKLFGKHYCHSEPGFRTFPQLSYLLPTYWSHNQIHLLHFISVNYVSNLISQAIFISSGIQNWMWTEAKCNQNFNNTKDLNLNKISNHYNIHQKWTNNQKERRKDVVGTAFFIEGNLRRMGCLWI